MKILITSGLAESDSGGPAQYGKNLREEFLNMGHEVRIISYTIEKRMPIGIRHIYFFLKVLPSTMWADRILALDTFSVGVPTLLATRVCKKKFVVRIGGDFLWETYVNRTGDKIILREFYERVPHFNFKERVILYFTKILVRKSEVLAFTTEWQSKIWKEAYGVESEKSRVVRNFVPEKRQSEPYLIKNFVWAGRDTKVKNLELLKRAGEEVQARYHEFRLDILMGLPHEEVLSSVKSSYAVVLPSLSDVCPNFILEGASFNKPFIVTRETGVAEVYNKGGILVDPHSVDDLIASIEKMLDSTQYDILVDELRSINPSRSWHEVAQDFASI